MDNTFMRLLDKIEKLEKELEDAKQIRLDTMLDVTRHTYKGVLMEDLYQGWLMSKEAK